MAGDAAAGATIWVDVEDFFTYFGFNPRPSGIQRVALELKRALVKAAPSRVRFVRRADETGAALSEVPWREVEAIVDAPLLGERQEARPDRPRNDALRLRVKHRLAQLPPPLRDPLFRAGVLQGQVGRTIRTLFSPDRPTRPRPIRTVPPVAAGPALGANAFRAAARRGDIFLAMGAPWTVPGFADLLAALKREFEMRPALLLHDLAPVRRPEWQGAAEVERFRTWFESAAPLCHRLLAVSRFTARDVNAYAAEAGVGIRGPVQVIPLGAAFPAAASSRPAGLPRPGRYVLFVSTLESRKNHALAVALWRKLMDEVRRGRRSAESVPELVFAGRVGTGVADVLQQLDNMSWLGGRIRLVRDPTDAELRALYEGCLFTLFPSLFEGWGLPVSESLALGKPCLASDATALPEAGGRLCRYFDPENVGAAHRALAALLDEPGEIARWQDEVKRCFQPTPWDASAASLLRALEDLPA